MKSTKSEVENDFENNNRIYVCVCLEQIRLYV